MNEIKAFARLQRLGYLPSFGDVSDEVVRFAVREFQRSYGLTVQSGYLTKETEDHLLVQRCGVRERTFVVQERSILRETRVEDGRLTLFQTTSILGDIADIPARPWPGAQKTIVLNYAFVNGTLPDRKAHVRKAMRRWEKVVDGQGTQIVRFVEDSNANQLHFTVGWIVPGEFGYSELEPNDIAIACLPPEPQPPFQCGMPLHINFDEDEYWDTLLSVEAVAIHELGHILGLVHAGHGATMDPNFGPNREPADIDPMDQNNLRALYPD